MHYPSDFKLRKKERRKEKKTTILLLIVVVILYSFLAYLFINVVSSSEPHTGHIINSKRFKHQSPTLNNLPKNEDKKAVKFYEVISEEIREISAYNVGDPAQTSGNPCISANGENICEALAKGYDRCAANFVPLGTKLLIDETHFCTVTDKMHSRYSQAVDLAFKKNEKQKAIEFGRQKLNVKILK